MCNIYNKVLSILYCAYYDMRAIHMLMIEEIIFRFIIGVNIQCVEYDNFLKDNYFQGASCFQVAQYHSFYNWEN